MNSIVEVDAHITFSTSRKIATSFRDQQLYDIFLLSCNLLVTARDNSKTINFMDEAQQAYVKYAIKILTFLYEKYILIYIFLFQPYITCIAFNEELLEFRFYW